MVSKKTIVNKETGEVYKTKEGVELKEFKFEKGDVFIIQKNQIFTSNKGGYETAKVVVKVKGQEAEDNIFVSLTPSQRQTLEKKKRDGEDLTQYIMCAYEYTSNFDNKKYIGIGKKSIERTPVKFDDFDVDSYLEENLDTSIVEDVDLS